MTSEVELKEIAEESTDLIWKADVRVVGSIELRTPMWHNFIPGLKKSDEFLELNPQAWQRHVEDCARVRTPAWTARCRFLANTLYPWSALPVAFNPTSSITSARVGWA